MSSSSPFTTVVATYRVCQGKESEFRGLLAKHYPLLQRLGLVTDDAPVIYQGEEHGGGPIVFEIFTWIDTEAPGKAHGSPEVMDVWGAMEKLVEDRDTGVKFNFPHVVQIDVERDGK